MDGALPMVVVAFLCPGKAVRGAERLRKELGKGKRTWIEDFKDQLVTLPSADMPALSLSLLQFLEGWPGCWWQKQQAFSVAGP